MHSKLSINKLDRFPKYIYASKCNFISLYLTTYCKFNIATKLYSIDQ